MYGLEKYATDAMAAQRKQLEGKLEAFDALKQAYRAKREARVYFDAAQNDEGPGSNDLRQRRWAEYTAANRAFDAACVAAFGEVKGRWQE